LELNDFMARMSAHEVNEIKENKKEKRMGENEKEIHIKAVKRADDRVSLMDMEGTWYSGWKNQATKESWDLLNALKNGDKADIKWTVNPKGFKNLCGISLVFHKGDEVKPVVTAPSLSGETSSTFPERKQPTPTGEIVNLGAKQTCVNQAGNMIRALAEIGYHGDWEVDPVSIAGEYARRMYQRLKNNDWWEETGE
jgi:hypothetical protein